jgi:hypothetical protein
LPLNRAEPLFAVALTGLHDVPGEPPTPPARPACAAVQPTCCALLDRHNLAWSARCRTLVLTAVWRIAQMCVESCTRRLPSAAVCDTSACRLVCAPDLMIWLPTSYSSLVLPARQDECSSVPGRRTFIGLTESNSKIPCRDRSEHMRCCRSGGTGRVSSATDCTAHFTCQRAFAMRAWMTKRAMSFAPLRPSICAARKSSANHLVCSVCLA